MTHVESTRTLLLTQGYEPIQIISWQRAITLLALQKVDVVEEYEAVIRAQSYVVPRQAGQVLPREHLRA
jgi:hypothetical protein